MTIPRNSNLSGVSSPQRFLAGQIVDHVSDSPDDVKDEPQQDHPVTYHDGLHR
jgi:hypothetical protein